MKIEEQLLHTPSGVRDIYGKECKDRLEIGEKIMKTFRLNGFNDIITPGIEYFDVFRKERGTIHPNDMYRFFDREGNTLALSPDITPSIARAAAKLYDENVKEYRFCYNRNTYSENDGYQGKIKEKTGLGIELIGNASVLSDAEVAVTAIEALINAGLKDFKLEIGNVAFFKSLILKAGFSDEEINILKAYIEEKNSLGAAGFVEERKERMPEIICNALKVICECFGSFSEILKFNEIRDIFENGKNEEREALLRLKELDEIIAAYGFSNYVTYDLGMVEKLNYYTGILLRGYTEGTGEPIISGGRYDGLMEQFGKPAPAVGMAVNLDILTMAMERRGLIKEDSYEKILILYKKEALKYAAIHRNELKYKEIASVMREYANIDEIKIPDNFSEIHIVDETGNVRGI